MPFMTLGSPDCCCGSGVLTCGSCAITTTSATLVVHGCGPSGFSCPGGISPVGVGPLLTGGADPIPLTSVPNIGGLPFAYILGSDWIFFNCDSFAGLPTYDWIQWSVTCVGGTVTLTFSLTSTTHPVAPARTAPGDTFGIITTSGSSATTAFTCSPLTASFGPAMPIPFYTSATLS